MNEQNRTVKNTVKPWKVVCTVNTFKKANSKRKALVNEWKKSDVTNVEVRVVKRAIDKFSVKIRLSQVPGAEKTKEPTNSNSAVLKASKKAKKALKKGKK
jgi:hypothetical protein